MKKLVNFILPIIVFPVAVGVFYLLGANIGMLLTKIAQ